MKFYVEFRTENEAFNDGQDGAQEKIRLLAKVANRIAQGDISGRLLDINGNYVGSFGMREEGGEDESI